MGGGNLVFTRMDGLISKRERVVVTIPTGAIVTVNVEGSFRKKLVVLVDGARVPGIPRHEFEVSDPYVWLNAIQTEMASSRASNHLPQSQPIKEVYVKEVFREVVKVPCKYCGALNEVNEKKCFRCGASIGER